MNLNLQENVSKIGIEFTVFYDILETYILNKNHYDLEDCYCHTLLKLFSFAVFTWCVTFETNFGGFYNHLKSTLYLKKGLIDLDDFCARSCERHWYFLWKSGSRGLKLILESTLMSLDNFRNKRIAGFHTSICLRKKGPYHTFNKLADMQPKWAHGPAHTHSPGGGAVNQIAHAIQGFFLSWSTGELSWSWCWGVVVCMIGHSNMILGMIGWLGSISNFDWAWSDETLVRFMMIWWPGGL